MHNPKRNLFLWCAATDKTFSIQTINNTKLLVGKCIFCNTKLCISMEGEPLGTTTLEHIIPRSQGGDEHIKHLAIACFRCNNDKGCRFDLKRHPTDKAKEVIKDLLEKRSTRMREPLPELKNKLKSLLD